MASLKHYFEQAKAKLKELKQGSELTKYLKMAEQDPSDMRVKLKIGEMYFKQKQIDAGIKIFCEVADRYTQDGFLLKAIAVYKNILKYAPGSVQFNEKLAELFWKLSMPDDALTQFKIVINYYQTHQRKDDAIRVSLDLVKLDPNNVENRMRLAEVYSMYGKSSEALEEYQQVANQLRKEMKDLNLLIEVYEKILLKKPDEKNLLKDLCVFYLKVREPKKVLRRLEKMKLTEDPQFKSLYEKAQILEKGLNPDNPVT